MTVAEHYDDTVLWLESLYGRPHVPAAAAGLRRAEYLLGALGNPHHQFRSVHVAGTGGKGSTTTMIGCVLQMAGHRTGYFRSPHLETYRERLTVDGEMIDEASWVRCFNRVVEVAEGMEQGNLVDYQLGRPTLFEVLFAMAALHFRTCGVEWAAIETGMGGRLDATNTLRSDVAVVTNISLEHTQVLGSTVAEIAAEKAAIIKAGSSAVTATRDADALAVIARRASEQGVELLCLDRDYCVTTRRRQVDGQEISLSDSAGTIEVLLGLGGDFQATNAATAFAAARALQHRGVALTDRDIARGLEAARVPGRFEVVRRSPLVLLDGAHHPAAMRALRHSIDSFLPLRRIVLLVAAMVDKDIGAMAAEFGSRAEVVVATRAPGTDRAAPAQDVAAAFAGQSAQVRTVEDQRFALRVALRAAGKDDVLVVTGSMYLVGWVRTHLAMRGAEA